MATISDELVKIATRCANKLTLSKRRALPSLSDLEEQCEGDIEELLSLLQDDDVFGVVDLNEQQKLADQIEAALPEDRRPLVTELTDQHTRHVWLQQEAAYHLGLAVGLKLATGKSADEVERMIQPDGEDEEDEDDGESWRGGGPDEDEE